MKNSELDRLHTEACREILSCPDTSEARAMRALADILGELIDRLPCDHEEVKASSFGHPGFVECATCGVIVAKGL